MKFFPYKLYPFNIDVYFKHRNNSLLKIVYIIQVLKNLNFIKQYNYSQLCIHLYCLKKDNGTMLLISKHVNEC